MNKKLSLLAVSVAMVLAGCNSDSSSDSNGSTVTPPVTPATPVTGKFIDNAVEGMYYTTTSGKNGLTTSDGEYQAMSDDTITFYIGGQNGLKVGAGSTRDILTPFEAAGKYERAVNLAILLQSLDEGDKKTLNIPAELRDPSEVTLGKMEFLSLDDRDSVIEFIEAMGKTPVDEAEAIAHMHTALNNLERGGEGANPFIQQGKFVRQIQVTQNRTSNETNSLGETKEVTDTFIHADTMMEKTLYNRTRGMREMTIKIADDNPEKIIVLAGSIDAGISGDYAEDYLACISQSYEWDSNKNSCSGVVEFTDEFELDNDYAYLLRDTSKASKTDALPEDRKVFMPFSADTIMQLNHYTANHVRNDRTPEEANETPIWVKETKSGSYDPITGIYTEIMKQSNLTGSDCDQNGSKCEITDTSEKVFYSYLVDKTPEGTYQERYIDFKGEWVTTAICGDGQTAVMTTVFDDKGQTSYGKECTSENDSISTPTTLEDEGELYTYDVTSDMWWFGQQGRESKATLTELNSVVRYCDADNYEQGNDCVDTNNQGQQYNPIYYVKWEYQPAGKAWDQGLLIRTKESRDLDNNGNPWESSVSIMQKVK